MRILGGLLRQARVNTALHQSLLDFGLPSFAGWPASFAPVVATATFAASWRHRARAFRPFGLSLGWPHSPASQGLVRWAAAVSRQRCWQRDRSYSDRYRDQRGSLYHLSWVKISPMRPIRVVQKPHIAPLNPFAGHKPRPKPPGATVQSLVPVIQLGLAARHIPVFRHQERGCR